MVFPGHIYLNLCHFIISILDKESGDFTWVWNLRIYHECELGPSIRGPRCEIEKPVPRITIWHHKACRLMANGDPERWIFLFHPHTNNGFFSCHRLICDWGRESWLLCLLYSSYACFFSLQLDAIGWYVTLRKRAGRFAYSILMHDFLFL